MYDVYVQVIYVDISFVWILDGGLWVAKEGWRPIVLTLGKVRKKTNYQRLYIDLGIVKKITTKF